MTNNKPKKKIAQRIYEWFAGGNNYKREYAAARVNRLNAGWTTTPTTANWERHLSLSTLIARSRQAARDDLHIVNYLRLMRANVIGQDGIQPQADAKVGERLHTELNKRVENAFWEWGHAETCTLSGKLDWKGVQDLAVTQCERDGAFLIEIADADNPFGFSLRTWDVTWLDFTFNEQLKNGNRIIQSVEVDANYKPIAYWLTPPVSEMTFRQSDSRRRTRIPADRIIHGVMIHDDESQVHGVPGTAAALLPAKNAYSYCEAQIMASRVAVNQFAVLKNTAPDGEGQFDGQEDDEGNPMNPMINSAPLSITQLLPGWEMQQFKPDHPTQNHSEFKMTLDMDIAAALGVPYFLLMGNWKAVNWSSSRGGLGEFRERCKAYQTFLVQTLCRRVFHVFLEKMYASGRPVELTPAEYQKLQNPIWRPRKFDYIDPTKDVAADAERLRNRMTDPITLFAERGEDFSEHCDRWDAARKIAAAKGIDIDAIYSEPKQIAPAPAEPDDDDNDDEDVLPSGKKRGYTNGKYSGLSVN